MSKASGVDGLLTKTSFEYTGKAITPRVTMYFNGKKMIKDKDYTVSYSVNKKIGTKLMNSELNSLSLDPDDRLIVALNQECAEAAHRMIFKLPNKAWLLTCKNLFTIGFEIDRLGNFD